MELDFEKLPRFKKHAMQILSLVPQWAEAHEVPRDAIINQIYIAHAWADSNPKKAPKNNMTRYLFSWMGAAKRYGNLRVPVKTAPKAAQYEENRDMTFEEMITIRQANMKKAV